jgi:hypothetical protein
MVLAAMALTAGTFAVAGSAEAATVYANCDALHHDWKYGVAKSKKAANQQYNSGHYRPAYGTKAQQVYWANRSGRDADKDGTACEVTR